MADTVIRSNTVSFSFTFYDANNNVVTPDSASLQLTYAGRDDWQTENIVLTHDGDNWTGTWDSSAARPGWVYYHAHAINGSSEFAQDDRLKLTGNRASMQHDVLPADGNPLNDTLPEDYV